MTTPAPRQVLFAHPWTDPYTGISYVPGQLATLDADTAKRLVYNGVASYTDGTAEPTIPPGPVDDVELAEVLQHYERKVLRSGASPGYVVTLDTDGQTLRLSPAGTSGSGGTVIGGATGTTQGLIRLAGDLGGTADAPTVPGLAQRLTLEQVQDAVAAMLVAGSNITLTYNDLAGTLTVGAATGGAGGTTDPEVVRDTMGSALVAGTGVQIAVSDDLNTITISAPGAVTGTDPETVRDVVAAALRAGPNVTVTVDDTADTITIGAPTVAGLTTEDVQDIVAAFIVPGAGIGKSYDDSVGTLTLTSTAGGGGGVTDPEIVRDVIAAALRPGTNMTITVDDNLDTITLSTIATVNQPDGVLLNRLNHTGPLVVPDWQPNVAYPANAMVLRSGVIQVAKAALVGTGSFDQASWYPQGTAAQIAVPAKVTGVTVGARGPVSISLSWTEVPGATSYLIERRVSGTTTWTSAGTSASASFVVTGLTASTSYQLQVTAANSAGYGTPSDIVSTSTTATESPDFIAGNLQWTPSAPRAGDPVTFSVDVTNIGADVSSGTLLEAMFAVDGVDVTFSSAYTGALASSATVTLIATGGPSGSATWAPPSTGQYAVTARIDPNSRFPGEANKTNNSTSATMQVWLAAPGKVTNLAVTEITGTSAAVSWSAATNATSYVLEYKTAAASTWTSTPSSPELSRSLTGLSAGTGYEVQVTAYNSTGSGVPATVSFFTDVSDPSTTPPGTPVLASPATNIAAQSFTSTWTAASNATDYLVQSRTGANAFATVATVTGTTYSHSNLTAGVTYDVRVIARNGTIEGTPSNTVTTTTEMPGTPVLASPATNITGSGFTSTWTAAAFATDYRVQRRTGTNAFATVATVTGTTYLHAGLSASTTYDVRIIARAGTVQGTPSNVVTTKTLTASYPALYGE